MGLDVLCQVSIKRRFMREKKDQVPGATYVVKHVGKRTEVGAAKVLETIAVLHPHGRLFILSLLL